MSKYIRTPYAEEISKFLSVQGQFEEPDPTGRARSLDERILGYIGEWFRVQAELEAQVAELEPNSKLPREVEELMADLDWIERAVMNRESTVQACAEGLLNVNPDPINMTETLTPRMRQLRESLKEAI